MGQVLRRPVSIFSASPKAATATALSQFLRNAKQKYLADIRADPPRGNEWVVVMGNEAGDLDSLASSIAYAFCLSTYHNLKAVPLIQIDREDLHLRAENLYALIAAGIDDPSSLLLLLNDVVEDYGKPTEKQYPFPSSKFGLVDHNCLGGRYSYLNPAMVITILDHHTDEKQHMMANPRIVEPAGSCASHVAHQFPMVPTTGGGKVLIPQELATLLLSAIFIDTDGLKPGKKALDVDYFAVLKLLPVSSLAEGLTPGELPKPNKGEISTEDERKINEIRVLQDLTKALEREKDDVSKLNASELLRRDAKVYNLDVQLSSKSVKIKAGLSTVPRPLKDNWAANDQLLKASIDWMKKQDLSVFGVLTSFRDDKDKHKREMAWFVRSDDDEESSGVDVDKLAKKLFDGLEASKELELEEHKIKIDTHGEKGLRVKVYKQNNAKASRKVIAPVMMKILEGDKEKKSVPMGNGVQAGPSM
ncbi:hypothetical protein AMATHDRAFT_3323 [Amanita thiersii Skay4041]|uniref:DHHA2 domain-containing protein n=1 Tax=Amanita thiersii Skay4041 TaxID=703135 RepID=A0A2A9NPE5_9AGAR|nr:hypothetical protein AMATHDRAFT_3323 [Amanita thiersii Skay4041]